MAILINFEGADYSFKSTTLENVKYRLKRDKDFADYNFYSFSIDDYDEKVSYYIKNYLNSKYGDPSELDSGIKIALQTMARLDLCIDNKNIFNDDKTVILLDRWTLSNIIYNMNDRDNEISEFNTILNITKREHSEFKIPVPDFVVLMVQNPNIYNKLVKQRDKCDDLEKNKEYMKKICNCYYDFDHNHRIYKSTLQQYVSTHDIEFKKPSYTFPELYCYLSSMYANKSIWYSNYYCYSYGVGMYDNLSDIPTSMRNEDELADKIYKDAKSLIHMKEQSLIYDQTLSKIGSRLEVFDYVPIE